MPMRSMMRLTGSGREASQRPLHPPPPFDAASLSSFPTTSIGLCKAIWDKWITILPQIVFIAIRYLDLLHQSFLERSNLDKAGSRQLGCYDAGIR